MHHPYLTCSRIRPFTSSEVNAAKIGFIFSTRNKHTLQKKNHSLSVCGGFADLQAFPCNGAKGLVLVSISELAPLNEACRS